LRILLPLGDGKNAPARYLGITKEEEVVVVSVYHQAREFGLSQKDEIGKKDRTKGVGGGGGGGPFPFYF
jgi:hypothetical protein